MNVSSLGCFSQKVCLIKNLNKKIKNCKQVQIKTLHINNFSHISIYLSKSADTNLTTKLKSSQHNIDHNLKIQITGNIANCEFPVFLIFLNK